MSTEDLEELGPIDIVVIGFPADAPMTGSAAPLLVDLGVAPDATIEVGTQMRLASTTRMLESSTPLRSPITGTSPTR